MNRSRHGPVLSITLIVILALSALWSYQSMARARSRAAVAAREVEACRELVERVQSLRARPPQAKAQEPGADETVRLIEAQARVAEIPSPSLVAIQPQPAQRLGSGNYQEKSTLVVVRQVTMRQLIAFLYGLSAQTEGTTIKSLRLTAARDTKDVWSAEVTLSTLIFAPKTPARVPR